MPVQMAGVFPTGIPEGGYDGPQAERIRQERVVSLFRERDPKLFARVDEVRKAARAAQLLWDAVRFELAGAVGNDGVHDVLAYLDSAMSDAEKRGAAASVAQNRTVHGQPEEKPTQKR